MAHVLPKETYYSVKRDLLQKRPTRGTPNSHISQHVAHVLRCCCGVVAVDRGMGTHSIEAHRVLIYLHMCRTFYGVVAIYVHTDTIYAYTDTIYAAMCRTFCCVARLQRRSICLCVVNSLRLHMFTQLSPTPPRGSRLRSTSIYISVTMRLG